MEPLTNDKKVPSMSVMSKKRYAEIDETLSKVISDPKQHALVMAKICSIMKFDPAIGVYTPEKGKKMSERRKMKAQELGISQYAVNLGKKYYESKQNCVC
jgi:hypothetical protein